MSQFRDLIARMAIDSEFARHARSNPDEVARQYGLSADETEQLRGLADASASAGPTALGARLSKSGIGTGGISSLISEVGTPPLDSTSQLQDLIPATTPDLGGSPADAPAIDDPPPPPPTPPTPPPIFQSPLGNIGDQLEALEEAGILPGSEPATPAIPHFPVLPNFQPDFGIPQPDPGLPPLPGGSPLPPDGLEIPRLPLPPLEPPLPGGLPFPEIPFPPGELPLPPDLGLPPLPPGPVDEVPLLPLPLPPDVGPGDPPPPAPEPPTDLDAGSGPVPAPADPTPPPPSTPPSSGGGGGGGGGSTGGGGVTPTPVPQPTDAELPAEADDEVEPVQTGDPVAGPADLPIPPPAIPPTTGDAIGAQELLIGGAGLVAGAVAGGVAGAVAGKALAGNAAPNEAPQPPPAEADGTNPVPGFAG